MSHKELEAYFDRIIPKMEEKEASMFTKLKQYWTDKFSFTEEPEIITQIISKPIEDCWSFQMYTEAWVGEYGQDYDEKLTTVAEPTEGTWMEQLDKILDVMSEHYGYDIKSQVYYSVTFPLNIEGEAGYGRMLNDDVLQQLLLSYPEAYALHPSMQFLMEKQ